MLLASGSRQRTSGQSVVPRHASQRVGGAAALVSPDDDDTAVNPVPTVGQVAAGSNCSDRDELDEHLEREDGGESPLGLDPQLVLPAAVGCIQWVVQSQNEAVE